MTFAVVYAGEHYLIDCLAGWLYAAIAFLAVWGGPGAWRRLRRGSAEQAPAADAAPGDAERRAA